MFRKTLILSLVLMLAGMAFAAELVELKPLGRERMRGPVIDELDWEVGDFSPLRRYTSAAEYYLGSGSLGDTMCVVFQPLAPCSIYVAQMQWFSAGNYLAYVWDYNEAASDNGRAPNRGASENSPLGEVAFGPFNTTAEGSQDWENMFTPEDLEPLGGGIEWDDSKFVVGFVKTQEDGLPQPLADDVSARGFTYTWFGGPWTEGMDNIWGAYSGDVEVSAVDLMLRVLVTYTENAPPIFGGMTQLPNTINGNKLCTVEAEILDDDEFTANLNVSVNGENPTTAEMSDDNGDNIWEASFQLDGLSEGDMVSYWIEAEDSEGATNSSIDDQLSFEIVAIGNSDAEMLVIDDNMGDRLDVLMSYLDSLGTVDVSYEYWSVAANKGLDEFAVNAGRWNTILVCGWGVSSMPAREWGSSAYANRFNRGVNFIYSDMDYFYAQVPDEAEPQFSEGDFAYDCFGIESGLNDIQPTDSIFFGEANDPVSGNWAEDAYTTYPNLYSGDWADMVVPSGEALGTFTGQNVGNFQALRKETDMQKTAYFAFDIFSNCEVAIGGEGEEQYEYLRGTEDFTALMDNLLTWIDPGLLDDDVEESSANAPMEYSLTQNFPNPFNPTTSITFSVPVSEQVALKIFNLEGREIATLFNGSMKAGSKSVTFDATDYASGIYFYRLETESTSLTKKMVLMK